MSERVDISPAVTTELPPEMLPTCAHYWLIETPAGETSSGRCKHCGATRDFLNYSQRRTMTRSVKPPTNGNGAQKPS